MNSNLGETIAKNAGFLAVVLVTTAILIFIAWLAQKKLCRDYEGKGSVMTTTVTAMMAALAYVLMFFELPLPFAPSFYKLDFSEIPVLICGFSCGPVAGILAEFIKLTLKILTRGTSTAFVGEFANFVVGCSFVIPATIIYAVNKSRKSAIIGCVTGSLVITIVGSLFNAFYLLPAFASLYGMPLDSIIGMGAKIFPNVENFTIYHFVLFCVAPLNLLKGALDSVVVILIYKPLSRVINRTFRR